MNPLGYIDDNLLADENIVYKAKIHKIIFFYPAFWLVIAITAWILITGEGQLGDVPVTVADLKLGVSAIFATMGLLQGSVIIICVCIHFVNTCTFRFEVEMELAKAC